MDDAQPVAERDHPARPEPFTNMGTLGFTKVPGHPHGNSYPRVKSIGEATYLVRGPDGRELGTADAAGSLALVLAALQPNDKP